MKEIIVPVRVTVHGDANEKDVLKIKDVVNNKVLELKPIITSEGVAVIERNL